MSKAYMTNLPKPSVVMRKDIVVIDNGSGFMKVGFAGSNRPEYVFPTVLGVPVVGRGITALKSFLHVSRPIDRGRVRNWEKMKMLWGFSFDLLGVKPSSCKLFLTEPLFNTESDRERIAEIMFEYFGINALYISEQPLLAMYAHGGTTGLVVDIGHGLTQVAPIYKGFVIPRAVNVAPLGGTDVTTFLIRLLMKKGYSLTDAMGTEVAEDIKERLCYVILDPESGRGESGDSSARDSFYKLPDGTLVKLDEELFMAPEVLFNPLLMGLDVSSLPELVLDSVMACDIDQRRDLLKNIILCGGTSLLKGLGERLERELGDRLRKMSVRVEPKVIMPKLREFYAWIGASKLASIIESKGLWMTKHDYQERGPSVINEKAKPILSY